MIKTYQDLFIWIYTTLWVILALLAWIITGSTTISILVINPIMIIIIGILSVVKRYNKYFNDWLNKSI